MINVATVLINVSDLEMPVLFGLATCQGLSVLFLSLRLFPLHSSYLTQTVLIGEHALKTSAETFSVKGMSSEYYGNESCFLA